MQSALADSLSVSNIVKSEQQPLDHISAEQFGKPDPHEDGHCAAVRPCGGFADRVRCIRNAIAACCTAPPLP